MKEVAFHRGDEHAFPLYTNLHALLPSRLDVVHVDDKVLAAVAGGAVWRRERQEVLIYESNTERIETRSPTNTCHPERDVGCWNQLAP